jgi:hypothetical protein
VEHIKVTIEGVTPLICNRFHDAAQISASSGTSSATVGERGTPQEQAELKLYKSATSDALVIPTPNLMSCITEGGKFFKSGKSKVTTQKSSLIPACLEIEGIEVLLKHKQRWRVDGRPVRIPATGGRIIAYRPIFDDWSLSMNLTLDTTLVSVKLLRECIDSAGVRIGLGDFRPDRKGPFGKFKVTLWKVEQLAKAA